MDKAAITPELVSRLVAAQFPRWAGLPVRPVEADGWDNATFRLGDEMSVRLPSGPGYAAQVQKEQRWLPVLAARLPLPIPQPLARGVPACGYPWPWSVYRWLPGEPAETAAVTDLAAVAAALAGFLTALQRIDASGGPPPGGHSCYRGGPLSAVIDFGCSAVGDPACDTAIAWTFFSGESRRTFKAGLPLDEATWARGRGWALWKSMIVLVGALKGHPEDARHTRHVIEEVLAEEA